MTAYHERVFRLAQQLGYAHPDPAKIQDRGHAHERWVERWCADDWDHPDAQVDVLRRVVGEATIVDIVAKERASIWAVRHPDGREVKVVVTRTGVT